MAGDLRERKRRAAMHAILDAALDLFDERGYAAVSVEDVAERAGVSASSVYRYFGTKAGIVVTDSHDAWLGRDLAALFADRDLTGSWDRFALAYAEQVGAVEFDPAESGRLMRRLRYFFREPDVRLAHYEVLDAQAAVVASALVDAGGVSRTQAHVLAHAFQFGLWAAIEQWYEDGAVRPIVDYVRDGLGIVSISPDRLP